MIHLVLLNAITYVSLTLYRKSHLLNEFNPQTWLFISSGVMFALLSIIALINPTEFFDKRTIPNLKKNATNIIIYRTIGLILSFLWLYLLKNMDLSKLMSLNTVFVTIFSVLLGIIILEEKITNRQTIGILLAIVSIVLIQYK
tara:strand:+ start:12591 stop:13019 length:429 start_codon:yes stop_codon:yes gene_type:complete